MTDDLQPALRAALADRYRVERELGRGGMATVYLARDLKHDRRVALKFLDSELGAVLGAERFLAEIRVTANLQHPNILPLFDSGVVAGRPFYVMPFVDGESLRQRLERERQLPVDEAIHLATAIAEALDYAHAHGVIHRDLKPENILLLAGQPVVADFGIALAVSNAGGVRITQTGLSLGTPQYMSPEQATGDRVIDGRTDVYSLGAVTYEMLVGEPPHTGGTAQAVIARLLTEEPRPVRASRPSVPQHVELAISKALHKLPADRWLTARNFATALSGSNVIEAKTESPASLKARRRAWRQGILIALASASAGAAIARLEMPASDAKSVPVQFIIERDSARKIEWSAPVVSPDGRRILYVQSGGASSQLFVRNVNELQPRALAGTEGVTNAFFSPDGQWIAIHVAGALRKLPVEGGAAIEIARTERLMLYGGAWTDEGTILFSPYPEGRLYRVAADGGTPENVKGGDSAIVSVTAIPDSKILLLTRMRAFLSPRMCALDVVSGQIQDLGPGLAPHYVNGQMVFVSQDGRLFRQPFDRRTLRLSGVPLQVVERVQIVGTTNAAFDISPGGSLAYRDWSPDSTRLLLLDRKGREIRRIPGRGFWAPRFSPDGHKLAFAAFAPGKIHTDIWIEDFKEGLRRLTTDGNESSDPHWAPGGRSLVYSVSNGDDIVTQDLDGGAPHSLLKLPGQQWPSDWSPDGRWVVFTESAKEIWLQPTDGGAPRSYVSTSALALAGRVSPDGQWLAYSSDESGEMELYVQSFPIPGTRIIVSAGGGKDGVWSASGKELYYWSRGRLMVAHLERESATSRPVVRSREFLFACTYLEAWHPNYDVTPDGSQFAVVTWPENRIVVALNAITHE